MNDVDGGDVQATETATTYKTGWYVGRDKLTNREFAFQFERGALWMNNGVGKPIEVQDHDRYSPFKPLVCIPEMPHASLEGRLCSVARTYEYTGTGAILIEAAAALASVTAERDQARQMLADAEKRIADMELDASLREEDERFADPL